MIVENSSAKFKLMNVRAKTVSNLTIGIVAVAALIICGCERGKTAGTSDKGWTASPAAMAVQTPNAPGRESGKARFWKTLDY